MENKRRSKELLDPTATPGVRAWCVGPDAFYPDYLVCSGKLCTELEGVPCPRSEGGRMPLPVPLREDDPLYSIDKGQPGGLCPPCCESQLSNLADWQGHGGQIFPEKLLPLRLFKCSMVGAWWIVPGLYDASPTKIIQAPEIEKTEEGEQEKDE
jgi:hypothetical protein